MITYYIGFIVCIYATATTIPREWSKRHPGGEPMPIGDQILNALACMAISVIWPIALAVWMRDLKLK